MKRRVDFDIDVLRQARDFYGRRWRSCIYDAWLTGDYKGFPRGSELQQIRNTAGPGFLYKVKI